MLELDKSFRGRHVNSGPAMKNYCGILKNYTGTIAGRRNGACNFFCFESLSIQDIRVTTFIHRELVNELYKEVIPVPILNYQRLQAIRKSHLKRSSLAKPRIRVCIHFKKSRSRIFHGSIEHILFVLD